LVGIWSRSWRVFGWTPRLTSVRDIGKPKIRGLQSDCRVINFGLRRGRARAIGYGKRGWKSAKLVRFPANATESFILSCGRSFQ